MDLMIKIMVFLKVTIETNEQMLIKCFEAKEYEMLYFIIKG